jgi:hypothetical protein
MEISTSTDYHVKERIEGQKSLFQEEANAIFNYLSTTGCITENQ